MGTQARGRVAEGLNLLLVDDDPFLLGAMRRWAERAGHRVTTCTRGMQAIDAARGKHFDAIICDVVMPDVDGVTVLRRLRRCGDDTPVVLMSGEAPSFRAIEGIECGAVCYVTKPVALDLIEEVLERVAATPQVKSLAV